MFPLCKTPAIIVQQVKLKTKIANTGYFGGNLSYSRERFHIGINGVHYNFEHAIIKAGYLYNAYALSGNTAGNYSVDYSYTYKNLHFFGEAASGRRF